MFPPAPPAGDPAAADLPAGADPADALEAVGLHRRLIGVRRRHPWLQGARTQVLHVTNSTVVWRSADGDRSVLTALSTDDGEQTLEVPGATQVLAGTGRLTGAGPQAAVRLEPHGWVVLGVG